MTPEQLKQGEKLMVAATCQLDQLVAMARPHVLMLGMPGMKDELRVLQVELVDHANTCACRRGKLLGLLAMMADIGITYAAIEIQKSIAVEHGEETTS